MIYKIRKLIGLFILIQLSIATFAQTNYQVGSTFGDGEATSEPKRDILKNWYGGINAGGTIMLATLREKPISWAMGAVFGRQFNRKIGIQANYLFGKMHTEGFYGGLNLANDVNFMDISLILKMNLNDIIFTRSPKVLRELYLLGGSGITFFNSKVINTADNTFVTGLGWDATGTIKTGNVNTAFIPIGMGMSFNVGNTDRYFLTTEFTYRISKDDQLDGGLTTHAGHYIYASVGFVYNIGKSTVSTQQITTDVIERRVKSSVVKQVKDEMEANIQNKLKPFDDKLANQSKKIKALQADVDMRINALNESLKDGVFTTQLPDGTIQTTRISNMAGGAIPSLASIYFAFNSLYITPAMEREIAVIAKIMKKNRKLKCEISGNASRVGSPEYNLLLSRKRSQAVARFLVNEFGINSNRLVLKSNGLTNPLAKNLHKINRRVDMQLFW